jgi:hypothetical protein
MNRSSSDSAERAPTSEVRREPNAPRLGAPLEPRVGHLLPFVSVAKVQGSLYSPFQSDQPAPVAAMKLP